MFSGACSGESLGGAGSAELDPLDGILGQDRAVDAIEFAVSTKFEGHNVFVLGPPGTGRHSFVRHALEAAASGKPTPSDWCYVNNFDDRHCPNAIELPAGVAKSFARSMSRFVAEARTTLSAAFDSDDYRTRHQAIESEFQGRADGSARGRSPGSTPAQYPHHAVAVGCRVRTRA